MRIPIKALKAFARGFKLSGAIVFAWDSAQQHVATWGRTIEDSGRAADLGNTIKAGLRWPESLRAQPSRVRKLQAAAKEAARQRNVLAKAIRAALAAGGDQRLRFDTRLRLAVEALETALRAAGMEEKA